MSRPKTMQRHNFFLPKDLSEELKEFSERSGVPMSEVVRRVLQAYLDKHKQKAEAQA